MKKNATIFVKHILESINLIEKYKQGITEEQFHRSTEKQDVIVRRLEIIGEATKNLSNEFREKYPEVPWKGMARMRDRISHHYFDIDYNIVWDTAINMLPPLKKQIEEILQKETCK
jgi:uncharacterized protein with HEPN domain